MLSKVEYLICTANKNPIAKQGSKGSVIEDDTIIYIMGGYLNRVRSVYKTNKNVKNNLD